MNGETSASAGFTEPVPCISGSHMPFPATQAAVHGLLAAVLGSEDGLFRDPFADFTPSQR